MSKKSKQPTNIEQIPAYILRTYHVDIIGYMTNQQIFQQETIIQEDDLQHRLQKAIVFSYEGKWHREMSRKIVLAHTDMHDEWNLRMQREDPLLKHLSAAQYEAEGHASEGFSKLSPREQYREVVKSRALCRSNELDKQWRQARQEDDPKWLLYRAQYCRSMSDSYLALAAIDENKKVSKRGRPINSILRHSVNDFATLIKLPQKKIPNMFDIGLILVYFDLIPLKLNPKQYLLPDSHNNLAEYVRRILNQEKRNSPT